MQPVMRGSPALHNSPRWRVQISGILHICLPTSVHVVGRLGSVGQGGWLMSCAAEQVLSMVVAIDMLALGMARRQEPSLFHALHARACPLHLGQAAGSAAFHVSTVVHPETAPVSRQPQSVGSGSLADVYVF